jgi:hypothetical protein
MRAAVRGAWDQRYAWLGVAYLVIVSALHGSRGGPTVRELGADPVTGAVSEVLAFYGAWYVTGFLLLGLGWWRAARQDRSPDSPPALHAARTGPLP